MAGFALENEIQVMYSLGILQRAAHCLESLGRVDFQSSAQRPVYCIKTHFDIGGPAA